MEEDESGVGREINLLLAQWLLTLPPSLSSPLRSHLSHYMLIIQNAPNA